VSTLQLHGHLFSSYTWKALIPLYANGTPFEFVGMATDRPLSEQFPGKMHPGGHIPVLVDGDSVVVEATSIVEHLAVHHPGPAPLIPADPAEAAVARMIDRVFDL
jgi:glutathione S-transferase